MVEPCNLSSAAQQWSRTTSGAVLNVAAGASKCLDVFAQNSSVAAYLDLWGCNEGLNQNFGWSGSELASELTSERLCVGLCNYT